MNEHEMAWRQLPAYAAKLLDETREAEIDAHIQVCEECRHAVAELAITPPGAGVDRAHIPAGVLARWPRAQQELRGLERELIAQHLVACEECRAALAVLGYAPVLPIVARTGVTPSRRELMLGVWAALATAAAFVFALSPQWVTTRPSTGDSHAPSIEPPATIPGAPPTTGVSAPSTLPPALMPLARSFALAGPDRGAAPETTLIRAIGGEWVLLTTPLLSAPAKWVTASLVDSRGAVLFAIKISGNDLVKNGVLLDASKLPREALVLRLQWINSEGLHRTRDYALRVTH